ncbi:PREDICTED: G patch domain-containing protein 4 [Acromyrmex echinatior]|uniref:G patch domain-containing protein 4 n=1 Tax=Acromyrmex echinatior TaxID=103372 RepID=F4W4P3_ACREC|nr:PREDICTED: G patch domain-containing protein 4 [Acromyrmex echinatior]EGI70835.1 G patch domain-containing protein 4 [Acromyrmex echinatior]
MANFAKQELLKYGWEEGKGLGKNENGITEPIKLATNQNKAGIGYDEYKPWWDRLYDDTIKNIKVELNDKEFSLMKNLNKTAATSKTNCHNFCENFKGPRIFDYKMNMFRTCSDSENLFKKIHTNMFNQKVGLHHNKAMLEPTEHNFSNGKSKRIAQQDALYLNTDPLLSDAMIDQKNDIADRNAKSDIEENKYGRVSMMQYFGKTKDFVLSKTAKKKNRKKLHKLIEQLSTCSLEENNNQKQNFLDMKLKKLESQKMKKDKHMEKKKNLKKILSLYNSMKSDASSSTSQAKITEDLLFQHTNLKKLIQDELFSMVKRKSIDQTSDDILLEVKLDDILFESERCEKEKDSTEHKVDQSLKMENVVDNKADESFKKDWVIIDVATKTDKERENFDCKAILPNKTTDRICKHDISKIAKYNNPEGKINHDFYFLNLNKIQKKKNLRPPSKGIRKIVEKLKDEALANELNSAIKNLTIFDVEKLPFKINANTIEKKLVVPTQTHRMPV